MTAPVILARSITHRWRHGLITKDGGARIGFCCLCGRWAAICGHKRKSSEARARARVASPAAIEANEAPRCQALRERRDKLLFTHPLVEQDLRAGRGRVAKFVMYLFVLIVLHVAGHPRIGRTFAEVALDQMPIAVRIFVPGHPQNYLPFIASNPRSAS